MQLTLQNIAPVQTDAVISLDGRYRYALTRRWARDDKRAVVFVMLNPSTADADVDDATVRKCIGFAKRWGFGGLVIVNLFALRSTDPAALLKFEAPVGPENDNWVQAFTQDLNDMIVVAWGCHGAVHRERVDHVVSHLQRPVMCLGTSQSGHPRHPLYVSYSTVARPWSIAELSHG